MALALEIAPHRHPQGRRDRRRRVRRAEGVVIALGAEGEARQAAALAKRADAVAPPGQDLVGIGLVADVPDQLVVRRIEKVMQRHRQLDDAKTRPQMTPGDRHRVDHLGPQLIRQLAKIRLRQTAKIRRDVDRVE